MGVDIELLKMQQRETSVYVKEFHTNYQLQMAKLDTGAILDYNTAITSLLEQIDAIKI